MRIDVGNAPVFSRLTSRDLRRVTSLGEARSYRRRDILFRQGGSVAGLYFLASGRVKLSQVGVDGQETIMRIVSPGEVFAALAAFEPAQSYPVSAHALTDAEVVFWKRSAARALAREIPSLSHALTREIGRHAQAFQKRLREVATQSVPQRLAHTLIRLAETAGRSEESGILIDFPLTRQDLAGMAGTTLFTVSRLLSEWSLRGIVETGRARVLISSMEALRAQTDTARNQR